MNTAFTLSQDPCAQFRELANRICELGAQHSVTIAPYTDPSLPHFSNLSPEKQGKVLKTLWLQKEFFEFSQAESEPFDSPQLIWRALARMGLTPEPDIFDKIQDGDVIEIYDTELVSMFKNLSFFRFVSTPLEELYVLPVFKMVSFSWKGYLYFIETIIRVKTGSIRRTFVPTYNRYFATEKMGKKRTLRIHLKWISPVRRHGERVGALLVNESEFADAQKRTGEW